MIYNKNLYMYTETKSKITILALIDLFGYTMSIKYTNKQNHFITE